MTVETLIQALKEMPYGLEVVIAAYDGNRDETDYWCVEEVGLKIVPARLVRCETTGECETVVVISE